MTSPDAFHSNSPANPFPETTTPRPTPTDNYHWLELRREGIGSSDAPALMGYSSYATPYTLWQDKTGRAAIDTTMSELQEMGHRMEPVIAGWAHDHLGLEFHTCGSLANKERPWQHASLDAWARDGDEIVIGEWKNVVYAADQWVDGIPPMYRLQVQHQMAVTGARRAYVVACFRGASIQAFVEEYNPTIVDILNEAEEDFWHTHVLNNTPPAMDADPLTLQTVREEWPRHTDPKDVDSVKGMSAVAKAWGQYQAALQMEKDAKAQKNHATAALLDLMEGHNSLTTGAGERTWARMQGRRFDTKAQAQLKAAHPDIYERYMTTREEVVFDVDRFREEEGDLFREYQPLSLRVVGPPKRKR